VKVLGRRIERKIEDVLEEDHLGFRKGKETRGAIVLLKIIHFGHRQGIVCMIHRLADGI
jgi:hypothetical protein